MGKKIKAIDLLSFTFILLCLFIFTTASAQDSIYKTPKPVFVEGSFLYDFPQSYGITAGIDFPLSSIIKNRVSKNGKITTKKRDRFWGMDAGTYRYPYNYTGVLTGPFIGLRRYIRSTLFYETSLGIGVLRTFYDGKVYEVNAAGTVNEKALFGRFYATTHLSSAFNFLLGKGGHSILALQIKPSFWLQYPFDSFIKPHVSVEAGIKYEIKPRNIIIRNKTKCLRK